MRVNVSFACLHFNDALDFHQVKNFPTGKLLARKCLYILRLHHLQLQMLVYGMCGLDTKYTKSTQSFRFCVSDVVKCRYWWMGCQRFTHTHIHNCCSHVKVPLALSLSLLPVIPIHPEFTACYLTDKIIQKIGERTEWAWDWSIYNWCTHTSHQFWFVMYTIICYLMLLESRYSRFRALLSFPTNVNPFLLRFCRFRVYSLFFFVCVCVWFAMTS